MTRMIAVVMVVGSGLVSVANGQTCYADGLDGPTLDPTWNVMGTGGYSLVGSDLEFMAEQGDLVDFFEYGGYGPPRLARPKNGVAVKKPTQISLDFRQGGCLYKFEKHSTEFPRQR